MAYYFFHLAEREKIKWRYTDWKLQTVTSHMTDHKKAYIKDLPKVYMPNDRIINKNVSLFKIKKLNWKYPTE